MILLGVSSIFPELDMNLWLGIGVIGFRGLFFFAMIALMVADLEGRFPGSEANRRSW